MGKKFVATKDGWVSSSSRETLLEKLNRITEIPVVSQDEIVQKRYREARSAGMGDSMAQIIAFQQAPGSQTDREFFMGQGTLLDQLEGDSDAVNSLVAAAKSHGYTPNPNDVYTPTLAEFYGDPKAFVPPSGGLGHVKGVVEERNWNCSGMVKNKAHDEAPDEDVALGEDLIQEGMKQAIELDPSKALLDPDELRHEAIQLHGSHE